MKTIKNSLRNVRNALRFARQVLRYVGFFLWALLCPKSVLAARLLAAESQLARCRERIRQKKDPPPRFTPAFRMLWVVLSKVLGKTRTRNASAVRYAERCSTTPSS